MIIVWGTKHLDRRDETSWIDQCEHCGARGRLTSFTGHRFFSLYWLPLIPLGHERVIRLCPTCKRYIRVKMAGLPDLMRTLRRDAARALEQRQATEAARLATMLGDAGDVDSGHSIADSLAGDGHHTEAAMARAGLLEMSGDADGAMRSLQQAADREGVNRMALLIGLGLLQADYGRSEDALRTAAQAIQTEPNAVDARQLMVLMLDDLGRYDEMLKTLDEIERIDPQVAGSKDMMKLRKKAARRAGRGAVR